MSECQSRDELATDSRRVSDAGGGRSSADIVGGPCVTTAPHWAEGEHGVQESPS